MRKVSSRSITLPLIARCRPLIVMLVIFGVCIEPAAAVGQNVQNQVVDAPRQNMPRIVKVRARADRGAVHIGSGVPIANDLVATNCHVTRRAAFVDVEINDADGAHIYQAVAQAGSVEHDVCVLRTSGRMSLTPVKFGEPPVVGESVLAIGFTGGFLLRRHPGIVLGRYRHDGAEVLETSTEFDHGASGGGLFAADGNLVGLITFRSYGPQARFFVTPVQWIESLLRDESFRPIAPLDGLAFWQEAESSLPEFLRLPELSASDAPNQGRQTLASAQGGF